MAELNRPALDARPDQREDRLEFRVDVPLDHLRGDGRGTESEFFTDVSLDAGTEMRAGADGA